MKLLFVRARRKKRLFVLPKRALALPAALLCICALCLLTTLPASVTTAAPERQLPIYCVQRDQKMVSLTFDAAWGNEDTQTLIDILQAHGVTATFFAVGDWAERYPESVKALAEAGNEVMNHSSDHAHFSSLSSQQIAENIRSCNEKIAALTGTEPTLFRCPYGEYDDHVIQGVEALGMTAVQWDVDSLDWKGISAQEIRQRVLKNVRSGSIILFHNAAIHTPEALPGILDALRAEGYTVVPVSQLLLQGETRIDNTGRQWPK